MEKIEIINITKKTILAEEGFMADGFFNRLRGLMGKKELKAKEALCIKPCNGIHMFFMRFSIDVLFIDKNDLVCKVVKELKPWGMVPYVKRAAYAIELSKGTIERKGVEPGDMIKIVA